MLWTFIGGLVVTLPRVLNVIDCVHLVDSFVGVVPLESADFAQHIADEFVVIPDAVSAALAGSRVK